MEIRVPDECQSEMPKPRHQLPDVVTIQRLRLVSLDQIAREWGATLPEIVEFLRKVEVPTLDGPSGQAYASLWTLEEALARALGISQGSLHAMERVYESLTKRDIRKRLGLGKKKRTKKPLGSGNPSSYALQ